MENDQATHGRDIRRALEPASVAVVGASRNKSKRGYAFLEALDKWGFQGEVYAVNPKYESETIRGYDVYGRVSDIQMPVDMACILTPAHVVPNVLEDCGRANVGGALVVAAGFGEVGNDDIEGRIMAIAREHGIRLIGPNTNGLINVHHELDLLGSPDIPRGGIAMVSQSGNMALKFVQEAKHTAGEGFSFFLSVGNESDVTFDEYLAYLATHKETDVAMCYVEGMADGRSFLQEATSFVQDKPLTVLKGGLSEAGKQSAHSHTASVAGGAGVIDDVYRQAGVVRVERDDELLPVSDALANLPPASGPNVAILSDGGGPATHAADSLTERGLNVPKLDSKTQEQLRSRVPDEAPNIDNPVDVITLENDMDIYADCASIMLEDPNVDGLVLCGYFGGYASNYDNLSHEQEIRIAERIAELVDAYEMPIVAQSMFAEHDLPAVENLAESPVLVSESIDITTRCMAALETYGRHLRTGDQKSKFVIESTAEPSSIIVDALDEGRSRLSEYEAKHLLCEYDAPVTPFERASSPTEAVEAASKFDGPVAMKILSRDIIHKSEVGGVALDVQGAENVRATFDELLTNARASNQDAHVDEVIVSPMIDDGLEVIAGITRDEELGPVVMFGLGGIFVEVLEDVSFRAIPLTEFDAREMIEDIKANSILGGTRGREAIDRDALAQFLLTISKIACENPQITELDVNPAIASPDGVEIVDAAVVLESDDDSQRG